MDLGLTGRVFLVTGGTRGLGRATAEVLLKEGAKVVVSSRTGAPQLSVEGSASGNSVTVAADNADPDTPDRLLKITIEAFGRLDGILVSVGGPPSGSTMQTTDEAWRSAFEATFLGAVRLARLAVPKLTTPAVIAFILSSSVRSPVPNLAISNGLRPGLAMVAKTLADELGPSAIRVIGLVPGRISTDRTLELEQADPGLRARSEAVIPLRRLGDPEEFGKVAAFTMSAAASYVTGSCVLIDGGMIRTI